MSEARETADLYPSIVEGVESSTGNFYRTGTFTPLFSSSGATDTDASITTGTYVNQSGFYVRVGDMVHVTGFLQSPTTWTYTNGGATDQNIHVAGFPFNTASSNGGNELWSATIPFINEVDWAVGFSMAGQFSNGTKHMRIYFYSTDGSVRVTTNVFDKANSRLYFSGMYRTEDA